MQVDEKGYLSSDRFKSSFEVSHNAKGEKASAVKVYFDQNDAESILAAKKVHEDMAAYIATQP